MRAYSVVIPDKLENKYKKVDKSIKLKIDKLFKKLETSENPRVFGKPLSNNLKGLYRYRVSNYRIIAKIVDDKLIILVIDIDKRSDVYK